MEVFSAGSAAEALDVIARRRPDIVILDIQLPDRSGLDSFEQIRNLDPAMPVIFITAAGSSDKAITAMKLGALDYLLKPLDLDKVREVVAQALRIRRFTHVPVAWKKRTKVTPRKVTPSKATPSKRTCS